MAVDERRRSELFTRTAAALGEEAAATMFEQLSPPETDLATHADRQHLENRREQGFRQVDGRLDRIDGRFGLVDDRFTRLEQRIDERADA